MKKIGSLLLLLFIFSCSSYRYQKEGVQGYYEYKDKKIISLENVFISDHTDNKLIINFDIRNRSNNPIYLLDFDLIFLDENQNIIYKKHFEESKADLNFVSDKIRIRDTIENFPYKDRIKDFKIKVNSIDYYANYQFELSKPSVSSNLTFKDNLIVANFLLTLKGISLSINNSTDEVLEIDWNKSAFVDFSSHSNKIVNSETKFIDSEKDISNSIIAPQSIYSDTVFPVKNIFRSSSYNWEIEDLLPINSFNQASLLKNKSIGLLLALKLHSGEYKNYYFNFLLKDVKIK